MKSPSTYDKYPTVPIGSAADSAVGWEKVLERLGSSRPRILCVESYPGVFEKEIEHAVASALRPVQVFRASDTLKSAAKLEQEPEVAGKLKFKTDEILIRLNDRLLAPPNDQTVAAAKGDVQAVAKRLYGNAAVVESRFTPQTVVEFRIRSKEKPVLETLLKKV